MKTNILTNFHDNRGLYCVHKVFQKIWPSFWPKMTHFQTRPRFYKIKTPWPSFMIIGLKMWPLEHTQGFPKIWPCDLVFDPTWTIFELIWAFIKTNILTNFNDNRTENVDSREYISQKVSERKILKFACFVPVFHLVTPGVEPILTPGSSYEQTW